MEVVCQCDQIKAALFIITCQSLSVRLYVRMLSTANKMAQIWNNLKLNNDISLLLVLGHLLLNGMETPGIGVVGVGVTQRHCVFKPFTKSRATNSIPGLYRNRICSIF